MEQNRTIKFEWKGDIYSFDEKEHLHTLNGKPLLGVTSTKDKILAKEALYNWLTTEPLGVMGWYNPTQRKYRDENKEDFEKRMFNLETKRKRTFEDIKSKSYEFYCELLGMARNACSKKKDDAADWGTRVHTACEVWGNTSVITNEQDIRQSVVNFVDWMTLQKAKIIKQEACLFSKEWWVGGIVDLFIEIEGDLYIADIKTSSGIYPDMFLQMGAYDKCHREMGYVTDSEGNTRIPKGYIVINLKKDSTIAVETCYATDECIKSYDAIVTLYKSYNFIKEIFE